jgi:hypothetical protein
MRKNAAHPGREIVLKMYQIRLLKEDLDEKLKFYLIGSDFQEEESLKQENQKGKRQRSCK